MCGETVDLKELVSMRRIVRFSLVLSGFISLSANAADLKVMPFNIPELDPAVILSNAQETDFSAIQEISRGSGADVFAAAIPSVVKVLTNEGFGTGVIASSKGFILTNYHVISGYETVGVLFSSSATESDVVLADVVRFDQVADLALLQLKVNRPGLLALSPAKNDVRVGDDVHAIGHPLGEDWTYTRGYVSQIRDQYSWQGSITEHHVADVIQSQTPISPGNSGGPLLNDNAELIGINSFGKSQGQNLNYSVAMSTVTEFLRSKDNRVRKVINRQTETLVNTIDENANGNPDLYIWDFNQNEVPDRLGYDRDENFEIEEMIIDENENGKPEVRIVFSDSLGLDINPVAIVYLFDKNEDDKQDGWGIDFDRDGNIDQFSEAQ